MSDPRVLSDRQKSLEEHFFARESEKQKQALRQKQERGALRDALRSVAAIDDETTLDRLVEIGITPDTWAAVNLVPLVEVAWANGSVEPKERQAVLDAAAGNGVTPGSPSAELLQGWLDHRPDARLLQAWAEYVVALGAQLAPQQRHALRDEVLGRARAVAEAAGGFLGIGSVSREEEVVLSQLQKAFEVAGA